MTGEPVKSEGGAAREVMRAGKPISLALMIFVVDHFLAPAMHGTSGVLVGLGLELLRAAHMVGAGVDSAEIVERERGAEAEHERAFNHDIARAVGQAVGLIAKECAADEGLAGAERAALAKIGASASEAWVRLVPGVGPEAAPVLEEQVTRAMTLDPENPTFGPVGGTAMWREVLGELARETGASLAAGSAGMERACEACRLGFARRLYDVLKVDLKHDGRAFAAVHLRMLGELAGSVGALSKSHRELAEGQGRILDAIAEMGAGVVGAQTPGRRGEVDSSARWLKRRLEAVDARLASIDERLGAVRKGQARQEQVTREGMGRIEGSQRALHEGSRRWTTRTVAISSALLAVLLIGAAVTWIAVDRARRREHVEAARRLLVEEVRANRVIANRHVGLAGLLAEGESWPAALLADKLRTIRDQIAANPFKSNAYAAARGVPELVAGDAWPVIEESYTCIAPDRAGATGGTLLKIEELLRLPGADRDEACLALGAWAGIVARDYGAFERASSRCMGVLGGSDAEELELLGTAGAAGSKISKIGEFCRSARGPNAELQDDLCAKAEAQLNRARRDNMMQHLVAASYARRINCPITARRGYRLVIERFAGDSVTVRFAQAALLEMDKPALFRGVMGAFVTRVVEPSAGHDAGIMVGDVLISYDGAAINMVDDLIRAIATTGTRENAPKTAEIVLVRGESLVKVRAPVGSLGVETQGF